LLPLLFFEKTRKRLTQKNNTTQEKKAKKKTAKEKTGLMAKKKMPDNA